MRYLPLLILLVGCSSDSETTPTNLADSTDFLKRGIAHAERGENDKAIVELDEALKRNPEDVDGLYHRGLVLSAMGRDFDARQDFKKCLAINDKHAGAHGALGMIYMREGRYQESLADLEAAAQLEPGSPIFANDLAWLLATCPDDSIRDGRRAEQFSSIAMKLGGEKWEYVDTHAAALAESGKFEEAVELLSVVKNNVPQAKLADYWKHRESYERHTPWRAGGPEVKLPDIFN